MDLWGLFEFRLSTSLLFKPNTFWIWYLPSVGLLHQIKAPCSYKALLIQPFHKVVEQISLMQKKLQIRT